MNSTTTTKIVLIVALFLCALDATLARNQFQRPLEFSSSAATIAITQQQQQRLRNHPQQPKDNSRNYQNKKNRRIRSRHLEDKGDRLVAGQENSKGKVSNDEDIISGVAQSTPQGMVDLVHLVPFSVQIALTTNSGIDKNDVGNIVLEWMNQEYTTRLEAYGYTESNRYAQLDSVVLFRNTPTQDNTNRMLQTGALYTAQFRGGVVFSRDNVRSKAVPTNDVLLIQQETLMDDAVLTTMLQESQVSGLGPAVVAVKSFLNPTTTDNANKDGSDDPLEIVIVVAIAVACVAFLFLLGAILWAFRYDRRSREAYLTEKVQQQQQQQQQLALQNGNTDRTDSDTAREETPEKGHMHRLPDSMTMDHFYPAIIGGEDADEYPESVISDSLVSSSLVSEDISTSLSQYYRAGMGRISKAEYARGGVGMLDDAGSVSSMESYGYSLDGGTAVVPDTVPYQEERGERIGGLPVEPDVTGCAVDQEFEFMEDIQILDLDKELADLDIKLTQSLEDDLVDGANNGEVQSYSAADLEEYQKQDLEELENMKSFPPVAVVDLSDHKAVNSVPATADMDSSDSSGDEDLGNNEKY